jgi:hypothetical protein
VEEAAEAVATIEAEAEVVEEILEEADDATVAE